MGTKMGAPAGGPLDRAETGSAGSEKFEAPMNGSHFVGFRAVTQWQVDPDHRNYSHQVFGAMLARRGFKFLLHESLESAKEELVPESIAGHLLVWEQYRHSRAAVLECGGEAAILLVQQRGSSLAADAASNDLETARELLDKVRAKFPAPEKPEETSVPFFFWNLGEMGASPSVRNIEAVDWKDVATNYTARTLAKLEALMAHCPAAAQRGNLLLWHGPPGTGKTFAIRALAWAWKKWCRFEYVVDPEALFGNGGYLNEVLLCTEIVEQSKKHRLLILEDCGEMMTADAKCVIGQGLSRLLNVSDGILGHATNVMILVTTNEDLGKLHPAIARPGRCFSEIAFGRFPRDEANRWLSAVGSDARTHDASTLSELYSIRYGDRPKRIQGSIGFRPERPGASC
jgi:uncharacterized protein DUF5925/ATPase family protein associated with various cellular activities (AAA)